MKPAVTRALITVSLGWMALSVWWPLWFLFFGALTPADELAATIGPALSDGAAEAVRWQLLPSWPTLQPLVELLLDTPQFFSMFWNSCIQVFPQLLGQLIFCTPAAWALSRLRFRGRRICRNLYMILMLLPFQVTMVPNYLVLNKLGLLDTHWALILPGCFSAFTVFIMAQDSTQFPWFCWRLRLWMVPARFVHSGTSDCLWECQAYFPRWFWHFWKGGTPSSSP